MTSRSSLYVWIVLILFALGGIWLFYRYQDPEPAPVLPATINHDCAPWDGSAFTVSIPVEESNINISIYQSPDINHPIAFSFMTFSFDEATEKIGHAFVLPPTGSPEQLAGKVFFERVEDGMAVEGEYHFKTETGKQLTGKFKAEWGNEIVYCG